MLTSTNTFAPSRPFKKKKNKKKKKKKKKKKTFRVLL